MSTATRLSTHRVFSRIYPRREILYVTYAGMEVCWLTTYFLLFLPPARLQPPYLTALLFGLLILGFHTWSRAAEHFQLSIGAERLVMLVALPVLILLGWRFYLHPGIALLDFGWIPAAGSSLIGEGRGHWTIMITVLVLWWRGLALSRRDFTFESVSFAFRLGLLLMIVGTVLLSAAVGFQVLVFIFPFFFFSLTAVALTRLEEVGQVKGYVGQLFDLYWLSVLAGTILAVLLAGVGLVWLARPQSIEAFWRAAAPAAGWLREALLWLLGILLAPFEPIFQWLARLSVHAWELLLNGPFGEVLQNLDTAPVPQDSSAAATRILEIALTATRLLCGLGLLAALVLAGLWLLGQERKRQREQAETHEDLDVSLGDALAGLLRRVRNRLRATADMVSQFGVGSDLLAAITVRNIYANTSRLARQRGYPRHKARTAYEYLPDLQAAFPQATAEAQAITDAYVAVAYGDLPTNREEMAALRAAYDRLRASRAPEEGGRRN